MAGGTANCTLPCPIQCVSLVPVMSIPLLVISFPACAMFPLLCIVLTFQFPVFMTFLGCGSGLFDSRSSSRLLVLMHHDLSIEESGSHVVLKTRISSVYGFFHVFLLRERVIRYQLYLQPGRSGFFH